MATIYEVLRVNNPLLSSFITVGVASDQNLENGILESAFLTSENTAPPRAEKSAGGGELGSLQLGLELGQ